MSTVARARVPADEFVLASTTTALPTLELEIERIVKSGDDAVMPLLWARGVDSEAFEAACEDDPTVEDVTLIGDFDDELLYQMEWIDHIDLVLRMLTNAEASILDAFGHDGDWYLRMLYPSREKLDAMASFCETHNLSFDVEAIQEMDGEPAGRYALTTGQYEALVAAVDTGYFEVPRETSLEELADDLGISHQALSERLRRGTKALVEDALQIGRPEQSKRAPRST